MALVDWDAAQLGYPAGQLSNMKFVLGPTPVIDHGNSYHEFIYQDLLHRANELLTSGDPSVHSVIWQYALGAQLYRMYFATGEVVFRNAARLNTERWRDGWISGSGIEEWYHNPTKINNWIQQGEFSPDGTVMLPIYNNPFGCEQFAAYYLENPGGEAVASRKIFDILKFGAVYYGLFYGMWRDINQIGGAREEAAALHWALMAGLICGFGTTVPVGAPHGAVSPNPMSLQFLYDNSRTKYLEHHGPVHGRPYWAWDFDSSYPVDPRYIGNMNLGGTGASILVKCERWHRVGLGTPDTRIYPGLRKHMDWLDFGTAPVIGSANNGSQWLPNDPGGATFRYYYYHNNLFGSGEPGKYGHNGTHPGPDWPMSGHLQNMYALGGVVEPNEADRARYLQRHFEIMDGLIYRKNVVLGGGPLFSGRHSSEQGATWLWSLAQLEEGGIVGPPPPPQPPPPPAATSNRRALIGFESGGHEAIGTVGTVQTTQKRSGTYALRLQSQASPSRYGLLNSTSVPHAVNDPRMYLAVGLRAHVNSNPSSVTIFDVFALDDGAKGRGVALQLAVATNGALSARIYNYDAAAPITGTTTPVTADAWVMFGMKGDIGGQAAAFEKDGVNIVDAVGVDLGAGNITNAALFEPPNTNGLSIDLFFDDIRIDGNLMPAHTAKVIKVQFHGTPAPFNNDFTKVGGADIDDVCNDTPGSATNHAKSTGAFQAQTGLVADVGAASPDAINATSFPLAAQLVVFAKEIATAGVTVDLVKSAGSPYSVEAQITPAPSSTNIYETRWKVDGVPWPYAVGLLTKPGTQRFYQDATGRAIPLYGSHNWNVIESWGSPPTTEGNPPSAFDFQAFLNQLTSWGHNATRLWPWAEFTAYPGSHTSPLKAYERSGTPGAADGGNKFDLTTFRNAYFTNLRNKVIALRDAGIIAVVCFFNAWDSWGNTSGKNIWHSTENTTFNGDPNSDTFTREMWDLDDIPATGLATLKANIHRVVDELNDLDNVVWEITNEPAGPAQTLVQDLISDLTTYEAGKPKQHPIHQGFYSHNSSHGGASSGATNAQLWALNAKSVSPGSHALNGAGTPAPDGAGDYHNDPPASTGDKIVCIDTDHIWGVDGDSDLVMMALARACTVWYMDPLQPGHVDAAKHQRARDAMGVARRQSFRLNNDLLTFTPQASGTSSPVNTGFAMRKTGDFGEWLVYRPAGGASPVTVDMSGSSGAITFNYYFMDPESGTIGGSGTTTGGATRNFTPPDSAHWLLRVYRADAPHSLFGLTNHTLKTNAFGAGTRTVSVEVYNGLTGALLASDALQVTG